MRPWLMTPAVLLAIVVALTLVACGGKY